MSRGRLARELGAVDGFQDPTVALEQYHTSAEVAAHLVHLADLQDDLAGETVVDLGCGTGMLALGAAIRGPARVVGLELDAGALDTARANERRVGTATPVAWILGDAGHLPLRLDDATVLSNPPFGAQRGSEHADRRFLERAREIGRVSYTVHNAGSEAFVESFVADAGGAITHAFAATLELPKQYDHQTEASRDLDAEVYRIEW